MSKDVGLHYTQYHVSDKHTFPELGSGTSESHLYRWTCLSPHLSQFTAESFVVSDLVENFDEASKDEANQRKLDSLECQNLTGPCGAKDVLMSMFRGGKLIVKVH